MFEMLDHGVVVWKAKTTTALSRGCFWTHGMLDSGCCTKSTTRAASVGVQALGILQLIAVLMFCFHCALADSAASMFVEVPVTGDDVRSGASVIDTPHPELNIDEEDLTQAPEPKPVTSSTQSWTSEISSSTSPLPEVIIKRIMSMRKERIGASTLEQTVRYQKAVRRHRPQSQVKNPSKRQTKSPPGSPVTVQPRMFGPCPNGCPGDEPEANAIIGGLLDIGQMHRQSGICMPRPTDTWQWAEAIRYTVEEINDSDTLLPGIRLGYDLRDVCTDEQRTLHEGLRFILRESSDCYYDSGDKAILGLLGPRGNLATASLARLCSLFNMPLVSYTAQDAELNNRCLYETLTRTITSDRPLMAGILALVERLKWTRVIIVHGSGGGSLAADHFQQIVGDVLPCGILSRQHPLPRGPAASKDFSAFVDLLFDDIESHPARNSTVVVLFTEPATLPYLGQALVDTRQLLTVPLSILTLQDVLELHQLPTTSPTAARTLLSSTLIVSSSYHLETGFEGHLRNLYCGLGKMALSDPSVDNATRAWVKGFCSTQLASDDVDLVGNVQDVKMKNPWIPDGPLLIAGRLLFQHLDVVPLTDITASQAREAVLVLAHALNDTVTRSCASFFSTTSAASAASGGTGMETCHGDNFIETAMILVQVFTVDQLHTLIGSAIADVSFYSPVSNSTVSFNVETGERLTTELDIVRYSLSDALQLVPTRLGKITVRERNGWLTNNTVQTDEDRKASRPAADGIQSEADCSRNADTLYHRRQFAVELTLQRSLSRGPLASQLRNARSKCTPVCRAGQERQPRRRGTSQECCATCLPCAKNFYSLNGQGACRECPDDSVSTLNVDECLPLPHRFIVASDPIQALGLTVAAMNTMLCVGFSALVIWANKPELKWPMGNPLLSVTSLLGCMLGVSQAVLFVLRPDHTVCLARPYSIVLTVCFALGPLLLHTIRLVASAPRPGYEGPVASATDATDASGKEHTPNSTSKCKPLSTFSETSVSSSKFVDRGMEDLELESANGHPPGTIGMNSEFAIQGNETSTGRRHHSSIPEIVVEGSTESRPLQQPRTVNRTESARSVRSSISGLRALAEKTTDEIGKLKWRRPLENPLQSLGEQLVGLALIAILCVGILLPFSVSDGHSHPTYHVMPHTSHTLTCSQGSDHKIADIEFLVINVLIGITTTEHMRRRRQHGRRMTFKTAAPLYASVLACLTYILTKSLEQLSSVSAGEGSLQMSEFSFLTIPISISGLLLLIHLPPYQHSLKDLLRRPPPAT